jgi:hypothetical protein
MESPKGQVSIWKRELGNESKGFKVANALSNPPRVNTFPRHKENQVCNVPTFGHYYITECYADQSSQMGVTASSGDIEGFYWARLASFIIFHHQDPFRTAWLWFRCIPTISVILSYYGLYFN